MHDANGNTFISVDRLKRDAKRYKKQHGVTHAEALNVIAKKHGYPHWPALTRSVNHDGKPAVEVAHA